MTTTIQQLPTYPNKVPEFMRHIPPPPLAFSDLMGKYNGRLFKGLLPQCIEDKIFHMVYEMYRAEMIKEWNDIYIKRWSKIWKWNINPDQIERQVQKRNQTYPTRVWFEINRDIEVWKTHKTSRSIVEKWRSYNHDNYFQLEDDGEDYNNNEYSRMVNFCWNNRRSFDRKRPAIYLDYTDTHSNSYMLIQINMSASLKFIKQYIKWNIHPKQIKLQFGGLSKYKNSNKNELINKFYTFDENKYIWR